MAYRSNAGRYGNGTQPVRSINFNDSIRLFRHLYFWCDVGIGALTFGLTMRYLGIALGMAIALGLCTVFGTLILPIVAGAFIGLLSHSQGQLIIGGVLLCVIGIVICGMAGIRKEKDLAGNTQNGVLEEFDLKKGLIVAGVAGVLSACFAFGLSYGSDIAKLSIAMGTDSLWQNSAVLVVILWGGFTTNVIWCFYLNKKNNTLGDYTAKKPHQLSNYLFALLAGVIWYCQFSFYGNGS